MPLRPASSPRTGSAGAVDRADSSGAGGARGAARCGRGAARAATVRCAASAGTGDPVALARSACRHSGRVPATADVVDTAELSVHPGSGGGASLGLPPTLFLAGFVLLALVFWTTFRTRVPLYLSSRDAGEKLAELVPDAAEVRAARSGLRLWRSAAAAGRACARGHGWRGWKLRRCPRWWHGCGCAAYRNAECAAAISGAWTCRSTTWSTPSCRRHPCPRCGTRSAAKCGLVRCSSATASPSPASTPTGCMPLAGAGRPQSLRLAPLNGAPSMRRLDEWVRSLGGYNLPVLQRSVRASRSCACAKTA